MITKRKTYKKNENKNKIPRKKNKGEKRERRVDQARLGAD